MAIEQALVTLDSMEPRQATVGYGELGRGGSLGYEGKRVEVGGRGYGSALSAHPPSRLVFDLEGRFTRFHCRVAINGDVRPGATYADFSVLADGRTVATARAAAGQAPRTLAANVAGARVLELRADTSRWHFCHAVWLEPWLEVEAATEGAATLADCLARVEILLPDPLPRAKRCVATLVTPGFEALLDDMLGSLLANGGCQGALIAVFAAGDSPEIRRVVSKYRATLVRCRTGAPSNSLLKGVLYSAARVMDADKYLCLDADMLVLGDLGPLFAALDAVPPGSILACREGNSDHFQNVGHVLCAGHGYAGKESDLQLLLGEGPGDEGPGDEGSYPLVINSGLLAGGRAAMLALDACIRDMKGAPAWLNERPDLRWRDQFLANLAIARLRCGVELDPAYNVQLHVQDVRMKVEDGRVRAWWHDRPVRVLHFSGGGRNKYPAFRSLFARVPDPLAERPDGDAYAAFLAALRAWIGRFGLSAVSWSFYSTIDGLSARVSDASTFPLLALLHYLVRANGCVRVLETGTCRGVSTACLASAVAHRQGGRVVTIDSAAPDPRRDELWSGLPPEMRACIEPRRSDSLAGMAAALAAGERYEAALLDSSHEEEHVWQELQLARQLVCPGGLILIHDACHPGFRIDSVLARAAAEGLGATRLWAAEAGAREDDGLGLAVIENRRRSPEGVLQ